MIFAFEYLNNVIDFEENSVVTLSIENKSLFRNVLKSLKFDDTDENGIVFSENYKPLDYKKSVCFTDDILNPEFSSTFLKKLYSDAAQQCHDNLLDELLSFKSSYENLIDKLMSIYEYELVCDYDFDVASFLKFRGLRPDLNCGTAAENLLQYIMLISKYSAVKCFVTANLHLYFSKDELMRIFEDLELNKINLLNIESVLPNDIPSNQRIYVIDGDLCEIS